MTRPVALRRGRLSSLRPGIVLALAVVSVVGVAGILRWDRELIIIGLVAGAAVLAINVVLALTRYWHRRNTELEAVYSGPEDAIRLRRHRPPGSNSKRKPSERS